MTTAEFDAFCATQIADYGRSHVAAGNWTAEEATERAAAEFAELLPQGAGTPDMLLFVAERPDRQVVGRVWVSLSSPRGGRHLAWVYDIEVVDEYRGRGYGRAILAAAEEELRRRGAPAVGLNVFGPNTVAQRLYATSGYELVSQQMRKRLD